MLFRLNFVCMDLGIKDEIISVTRAKKLMEIAGQDMESSHFEQRRGFQDLEFDGKKSKTSIGEEHCYFQFWFI